MIFIVIAAIIIIILQVNKRLDSKKFITETQPYFAFLKEDDYEFLLTVRYGKDLDYNKLFGTRVRNALIAFFAMFIVLINQMNFVYFVVCLILKKIYFTQIKITD